MSDGIRQQQDDFVQLGRSFHELAKYARESESLDLNQAFCTGPLAARQFLDA